MTSYFNPRSPRGGATGAGRWKRFCAARFQSTLPTRGSDRKRATCVPDAKTFQSTLPTRGSDDVPHFALGEAVPISIHAPHEGERPAPPVDINDLAANFNPRSPRGGATWARLQGTIHRRYFNPRSPRGGATKFAQAVATGFYISIHAPHEGERLGAVSTYRRGKAISIHAPHEGERRIVVIVSPSSAADFNPRSPRGGATILLPRLIFRKNRFQSTLPTRGSDQASCLCRPALSISIHAPHEGERRGLDNIWIRHIHFNPRSPRGGATPPCYSISFYLPISIHAPHEGERRGAWCVRCF